MSETTCQRRADRLDWALALSMQWTRDPRVIAAFLGLLALLSAGGLYLIPRRFLGRGAACAAALLFAVTHTPYYMRTSHSQRI